MLDPAAMGTLLIGLDSVRIDARWTDDGTPIRPPKRSRLRTGLANRLRTVADRLEPPRQAQAGTAGA